MTDGIVNIHGKQYKTVALRVSEFRIKHPNHSIVTDLVHRDDTLVVMKTSFGFCVAGGAITLFGVPVAIAILGFIGILLLITVVGAGLGILAFTTNTVIAILYFVLIYTSTAFLSFLLGEVILSKSKLNLQKYGWKVLAYLIGLAITMIVYSIPFIGGIAKFAGVLFGLGGLTMVLKDYIWTATAKCVKK